VPIRDAPGDGAGGESQNTAALGGTTTRQLTLKTAIGGQFVSAEQGGGGDVNANRAAASTWETFTLLDLNGGSLEDGDLVNLQTLDGHFVCAEGGGGAGSAVNATRTQALDWETFRVVKLNGSGAVSDGDQIALQTTVRATYVSALNGGGGGVVADRAVASGWETFVVGGGTTSPPPGWTLVWSDEFNGAAGSPIDGGKWSFDQGGDGWGNDELEFYTDRTDNVRMDGQGHLEIVARAESFGGRNYTSGRITTGGIKTGDGKFTQKYGRFEALIKMPSGKGIWPAFWTLGDNVCDVKWPASGEISIMESINDMMVNYGSAIGPGYGNSLTGTINASSGSFAAAFHVYAIEWELGEVRWYVDGIMYQRYTAADVPAGSQWVLDHPFFILLNVAVGGNFPGNPDASTSFPQSMLVDYVRVYTR
jgi:beta-glucanase (GH16 family)